MIVVVSIVLASDAMFMAQPDVVISSLYICNIIQTPR